MNLLELGVNFFVALFALIDPIGNVPIFAAATVGATAAQRRLVAVYITLFAVGFLLVFYFTGVSVLQFFGISLSAFRIAGGILLFLLGLDMSRSDFLNSFGDADATTGEIKDVRAYARKRFERLVVPFAMPLLIGPGAISTVIIQASEASKLGPTGWAIGAGAILAVGIATLLSFMLTGAITKLLGRIGMAIVVRVLGLILCAMAVQFVLVGISDATHNVIQHSVAKPYAKPATPLR
ncbi:MAG TPA: MarC family protein [Caulobacteraceae bacterium]|jgi:multiple antibiotic resistance protein|nr:MarC family protein [Caulobacteraceae bacterium]